MHNVDTQLHMGSLGFTFLLKVFFFYFPMLNEQPFLVTALSQGVGFSSSGGGTVLRDPWLCVEGTSRCPMLPGPKVPCGTFEFQSSD